MFSDLPKTFYDILYDKRVEPLTKDDLIKWYILDDMPAQLNNMFTSAYTMFSGLVEDHDLVLIGA